MSLKIPLNLFLILLMSLSSYSQDIPNPAATAPDVQKTEKSDGKKPNGKRIRRQLGLIVGVEHDEEFLIPEVELSVGGRTDFFDIERIKGTDYFRIMPKKAGNGITTLRDKKTGQIIVEIRFDIRDDSIEKTMREVQALLADIEGIEFKIVNNLILVDGYVLIPHDLIRIQQIISQFDKRVSSLVTLSPVARKRIAEFITNDINNPEIKVTAIGDFLKLEGQVSTEAEKSRIKQIVQLYIPDLVFDQAPASDSSPIKVVGRKPPASAADIIIDLITVRRDEDKIEPPPKMIQIVTHFVKFGENYGKSFSFRFSPAVSGQAGSSTPATSTIDSTINLLNNLLPKLNWEKKHGFAKVLDTASILVQDKVKGSIRRDISTPGPTLPPAQLGGIAQQTTISATVSLDVIPTIKSERSGLIELKNLIVTVSAANGEVEKQNSVRVETTISVRDRYSAAFGGVIKKGTETSYGAPASPDALITLNARKSYTRDNSQFVVFVTPTIKSSASAGVTPAQKKFRLKD